MFTCSGCGSLCPFGKIFLLIVLRQKYNNPHGKNLLSVLGQPLVPLPSRCQKLRHWTGDTGLAPANPVYATGPALIFFTILLSQYCGILHSFIPLIPTLKLHSNGLLHSNTAIRTLPVDEWAVIFGSTARRGAQSPPHYTECNSPPINGQCTNFILFDVAL